MYFALILTVLTSTPSTTVLYGYESLEKCLVESRDIAANRKAEHLALTCVPAHEAD